MSRKAGVVFLALVASVLCGCASVPATKYYQLTVPNDAATATQGNLQNVSLIVGNIEGTHIYRDDRLIYGNGGEELGAYEYERWVEPPTEMIRELLVRQLRMSGQYKDVYASGSAAHGDYLLHGNLYDFKEISGNPMSTRVTLDLQLRDVKTGADVWSHHYAHDEAVNGSDVRAIVSSLDQNMQQGIRESLASLAEFLSSHPAK